MLYPKNYQQEALTVGKRYWRKFENKNLNSKPWRMFFDKQEIVYINCVPEGQTVKKRLPSRDPIHSPWITKKKATWIEEKQAIHSPSWQCIVPHCIGCQHIWPTTWALSWSNSRPYSVRLFFVLQGESSAKRNQFSIGWWSETERDGGNEHASMKWLSTQLQSVENLYWMV